MAEERKPISKRKRFEIFKRDRFQCQYCSAKPPKVPLEIDHIIPVSKGGTNDSNNLVTACFDCNRGKSNIELSVVPESLSLKIESRSVALEQHKQFKNLLKREKKQMEEMIDMVESVYSVSTNNEFCFSDKFRISVKKFITELGVEDVIEAMESASTKRFWKDGATIKYFCGICWRKIKGE